tara:strand:- start:479 stop:1528 length:1050 start_codon:yes stop_codon:yes gene_type:complete
MKLKNISNKILKSFNSRKFKYIELPSIIETNHIVQRSGENFRKYIFSFYDQEGKELCLRPDLTIVSCLQYLEKKIKTRAKLFYEGQAYRKNQNFKQSIIKNQIGFEIIGSKSEKNDDKEIIDISIKALKNFSYKNGTMIIGNLEIFNIFINKLDIPKRFKLRLSRHFWRSKYFNELLKRLETNSDINQNSLDMDKKKIFKIVKENKNNVIAGRSVREILERFEYKINDPREISKGKKVSKIIKEFLKINCPIEKASKTLNSFFKKYNINLIVDQNYFPISKNNISKIKVQFSTSFGRELEYYTGMVFSIEIKSGGKKINLINGGRFDNLIENLGGKKKVPAVGAAINVL